ncbi:MULTISPECIES: potassium channel family protein [Pseudothermotoga]|uniref:TrkA-N domain protein n=1 Tax=Pseudothermotoga lettingae (strain ATCC BAA-301 / DSM 14385 / NBRC 107922 / TMO) TaxID=416591 RepID=A8F5M5_PSELT|nr:MULTISPECIES: NAD-binding protein [Pseudothermotoga]ABV33459.1 TrkA-N domain protein [Pseudothermotoga lettingae TMO]KUK20370.1 MAG: TrkA-N domain protein [Pseudothermotoga lettingae]MDI3495429.1 trk/ktr system potassium uptake protein [Pseudothermotoga sp.]MDK2883892.1 trk/ktr system potassium uptake protein [Pseudothermotoga sp.]GLI49627.1 TRK system potassium uptake protein TrkA [Pseudothermotoga lettingae TMO]
MKIVIVGGYRIAYHLARSMISKGYHVYIINKDPQVCEELARKFSAVIINGDGSKKNVLDQIEFSPDDIVVILTNTDRDSLIISQMIRKYYGVERIVTLVNDPENIEVFNRLGVRVAVSPAALLGQTIQNLLSAQEMEDFFPVEEGKLVFLRLEIPDNSPSVNKKLKEIDLPNECIIGGILRNNDVLIPRGETELLAQDRVFIICEPKVQTRVIKTLVGE